MRAYISVKTTEGNCQSKLQHVSINDLPVTGKTIFEQIVVVSKKKMASLALKHWCTVVLALFLFTSYIMGPNIIRVAFWATTKEMFVAKEAFY